MGALIYTNLFEYRQIVCLNVWHGTALACVWWHQITHKFLYEHWRKIYDFIIKISNIYCYCFWCVGCCCWCCCWTCKIDTFLCNLSARNWFEFSDYGNWLFVRMERVYFYGHEYIGTYCESWNYQSPCHRHTISDDANPNHVFLHEWQCVNAKLLCSIIDYKFGM